MDVDVNVNETPFPEVDGDIPRLRHVRIDQGLIFNSAESYRTFSQGGRSLTLDDWARIRYTTPSERSSASKFCHEIGSVMANTMLEQYHGPLTQHLSASDSHQYVDRVFPAATKSEEI